MRHAGILRFTSGEELFDAAEFFEGQPLPRGRRVGIVSNSTGVATLAADGCVTRGLVVGELDEPDRNPLVLGFRAGPEAYATGIRGMLEDAAIDAVMACYVDLVGGDPRAVLEAIAGTAAGQPKPVVASVVTADGHLPADGPAGMPELPVPGVLCRRAGAGRRAARLALPAGWPAAESTTTSIPRRPRALLAAKLQADGPSWLGAADGAALLATHGIATVASRRCADADVTVAVDARASAGRSR